MDVGWKIIVYSPPGHGKTVFLGSGAGDKRLMPMLIFDVEGGSKAIRKHIRHITMEDLEEGKKPLKTKIDVLRITTWTEFKKAIEVVHQDLYKTICIDSLSELNYASLDHTISQTDHPAPEQRDYLISAGGMRATLRAFRDLPMNVILTALARLEDNPKTRRKQYFPALVGKLCFEVPALYDIVGYLGVQETGDEDSPTQRVLMVQPSEDFSAKDRSGDLGEMVEEPTLTKIFDLIEEGESLGNQD